MRWTVLILLELENLSLSDRECSWLKKNCPYLKANYLDFLSTFRFNPSEHVRLEYISVSEKEGDIHMSTSGLWKDTILYEIPLLALVSEAYFKFCDCDWNYEGQEENAYQKGARLLQGGCFFSEFGTRRRRDSQTQDMVISGLKRAAQAYDRSPGKLTGTSNVYFAMKYELSPVGTMAHEWFMGIAATTSNYEGATRDGLQNWCKCFGRGVLAIALTDTFGTPAFLKVFEEVLPKELQEEACVKQLTYAEAFSGVRQDSGDPHEYVRMMQEFYKGFDIQRAPTIVFSDSLNIEKSLDYKQYAEQAGFQPTFGIGTFFTSKLLLRTEVTLTKSLDDFVHDTDGSKSTPLNIVIKLSSAEGHPAVKLSDDMGKNTGDSQEVEKAKIQLGYVDKHWIGGDEKARWGS